MKFFKLLFITFISLTTSINADLNKKLIDQINEGKKLIFIRHAYAPGSGDPNNFNLNDCLTQRNLSKTGRIQAKNIGKFFKHHEIDISNVFSSEWCRCMETAKLAFDKFEKKNFLNSFYSPNFQKNRVKQIADLKAYVKDFKSDKNLIFVTHYVVIFETLNYAPTSGEIVISDMEFNKIGSIEIN